VRPARCPARAALLLASASLASACLAPCGHALAATDSLAVPPAVLAAGGVHDTLVAGSLWRHFGIASCADLAGRPIVQLRAVPHPIWDPVPPGPLAPVFALGNRLHVRTRASTVRASLLVREGEPFDARRVAESERALRALRFLSPESVLVRARGDSVEVAFHTRDHWTTNPEVNLESGGGNLYGAVSFTERNFLGRGWGVSASYREDPVGITRGLSLRNPHAFGSRWQTEFTAATGTAGKSNSMAVVQPYFGEDGARTLGVRWSRVSSEAQLFERGALASRVPRRTEEAEVWWGVGERTGTGLVRRARVLLAILDRRLEPSLPEPTAPPEFADPGGDLRQRRVGGELRWWKPRFIQRRGIDRFDRVEDIDLGGSFSLEAGFAPKAFGGTVDEGFARLRLAGGIEADGLGFGWFSSSVRSRFRRDVRELLGEVNARWVQQPHPTFTLVLGALGAGGREMPGDFQLVVGGLDGLRAYPVHALAGTQLWRLNAEARWVGRHAFGDLLRVGGAVFADAAHVGGRGSNDAPWHHDAGFGLRLSLPQSSMDEVIRVDIAWPIAPTRDGRREPVLTFGSSQAF